MKFKGLAILIVACLALGMLGYDASADGREPASCLLFPYYNTQPQNFAVITITNTCIDLDDVYVRLVWVDNVVCTPEDQWIKLTCGDTYTFIDWAQNPQSESGFMYAYAVEGFGSTKEIDYDYLIGQELIFATWDPQLVSYGINAVPFEALAVDGDGLLKLDGSEFEAAPRQVYFPRFFGQDGAFASAVILINLTGGQWFWQQANVLVWNDNEQPFSTTVYFPCWEFLPLTEVSGATYEDFLLSTNHNPLELWDGNNNPLVPHKKTGWIWFEGDWAWNPQTTFTIDNPSLYAVLVENVGGISAADLPWEFEDPGTYNNAALWSTNPWGN
jgi:hypothetical protein